jgi:hypothetical protein
VAKEKVLIVDEAMMTALASLSTIVAGNIMAALYNRSIISDRDIDQIIEMTAAGGLGDPSLDKMAQAIADALRAQVNASMN